MRRTVFIAVLTLGVATPVAADFNQDIQRCNHESNFDIKIGACTQLIQSGRLSNENLAAAFMNRGNAYSNKGQKDRAIQDFDQAIHLNPNYANAFYNRGAAYFDKGQFDRAIQDLGQAIRLKPDHVDAFFNRGLAHYKKEQFDLAIKDYDQAIRLMPNDADAFYRRGNAHHRKSNYDQAIRDYDQAIRLKPDFADAFGDRGGAYIGKGQHDRAIQNLDQAIRLNPDVPQHYFNRGSAHFTKGAYDRAIEDFTRLIRLTPNDGNAFHWRGRIHSAKGQHDLAIQDFDQVTHLFPNYAYAYVSRGNSRQKIGDFDRAIQDFDQAILLKPDLVEAFYGRGLAYSNKWQDDRAIQDFDQAIRLKPDHAEAFFERAIVLMNQGRYGRAIQDYDQAIRLKPDYVDAMDGKARLLATAPQDGVRDGAEAVRLAKRAVSLKSDSDSLETLAAAHAEAGDFAAAIETQQKAMQALDKTASSERVSEMQTRLDGYRQKRPYRMDPVAAPAMVAALAEPAASAREPPLCAFVKRVLADRPNEFAAFKGEPDAADSRRIMFKGTAAPDELTKCKLNVRHKIGGKTYEPYYSCWSPRLPVAEGKARFDRYATELRACLGGAAISENRSNEQTSLPREWLWSAQTADYLVKLWMGNVEAGIKLVLGLPAGENMDIEIRITDLSPPKPGAALVAVAATEEKVPTSTRDFVDYCKKQWTEGCHEAVAYAFIFLSLNSKTKTFCPPAEPRPGNREAFRRLDDWLKTRTSFLTEDKDKTLLAALPELYRCR